MKTESAAALESAILAHIKRLESFGSRYYAREGNKGALAYIKTCLKEYGYEVQTSLAFYQEKSFASPWALKAGKEGSEKLYLLTAHFDSISQDPKGAILEEAPGADDNATGVAILLETAKAFSKLEIPQSVGFVFFNVEETGQQGSKQFAADWKKQGKRLDGVINIDTIGTWPASLKQGGKVNFVTNEASRPLLAKVEAALGLSMKAAETPWEDDHASFWAQGFQAIELTEEGCTPAMHTPYDTSEKLDLESVAGVAEAVMGMVQKHF